MLAGNVNIVRVSGRESDALTLLLMIAMPVRGVQTQGPHDPFPVADPFPAYRQF